MTEHGNDIVLEDIVFYAMPLGWLGQALNKLLIADRLEKIFKVRHDYLEARWGLAEQ